MSKLLRILSWNVNGIRAVQKRGFMEWLESESPDILCLQETKASQDQLSDELINPSGYHSYWNSAQRKGYSGVAVYSKQEPLNLTLSMGIKTFDDEGRFIQMDFGDFILFNVYFPNGKSGPERLQFKMDFYDAFLELIESMRKRQNRLIFVGDVNTAHNEIDLARPKENSKISGFLPIEREWMDKAVSHGYVDTFRHLYPDTVKYSWWDLKSRARERNVGWRIDYVFVTKETIDSVKSAFILNEVMGSDHCPVGVQLESK
ncbi:MAG: exodeoxyribonuclease III [Desulfomonile tiedjei]|nr:exodeoxyribonuclease III [Desulfomonile tiedjei]